MRLGRVYFGHISGSHEAFWPIFLPLNLFLWDFNIRVKNVEAWRLAAVAVVAKTWWTHLKS